MSFKKASRTKSLSLGDDFPLKTLPMAPSSSSAATKAKSTHHHHHNANPLAIRQQQRTEDTGKIMKLIDDNIIGKGCAFLGPYGRRKLVYADYLSSGRSLQFLEDYVNKEVLPAYGDLSCTSAVTGLQSQLYNNEVRDLVKSAVNASPDDEIIFCDGNYASPIERLCYMLCYNGLNATATMTTSSSSTSASQSQLNSTCLSSGSSMTSSGFGGGQTNRDSEAGEPQTMTTFGDQQQQPLQDSISADEVQQQQQQQTLKMSASTPTMQQKLLCMTPPLLSNHDGPVLFVSTCEIADNLQPWIDAGAQIERVAKNREGFLDLGDLSKKLAKFQNAKRRLIGLFSSASRLTGILADDVATTILLHQYGALSLWNYSHSAPFTPIDTNPLLPGAAKDVVFFTTSKFIGGVQAPGIIVVKKYLLNNLNVTSFNDNVGVIGAVRAGLVIQLKESLGIQNIMNKQEKICKQMLSHIRTIPEIVLLGPNSTTAKRLPTICFLVKHPRGAFLHNRFVVAILNDIFGIQATAGSHIGYALGINEKLAIDYERILMDETVAYESLRPGYTRLSFPYFMSDNEIGFILEALKMVATEAWKLLPQYECDNKTGEWRHHSNSLAKERKWLGAIRYTDGKMLFSDRKISGPGAFPQNYQDCLQTARNLFNRARKMAQKSSPGDNAVLKLRHDNAEVLRWYMLPAEAHELLVGHSQNVRNLVPFHPNKTAKEMLSLLIMHRHNSLSALDVRKFKSRSLPLSPVQGPRHQSTPSPISPVSRPDHCISPPIVRFSLGGEVTTISGLSSPQVTNLINSEQGLNTPSRHSSMNDCPEDIYTAYVKEVTEDIATEIKSELREVISQVEDVLENTDGIDLTTLNRTSFQHLSSAEEMKSDAVSAADVAEYLKEFSKEMASEVKSEIREVCNTVTDFNSNLHTSASPDLASPFLLRKNSPPDLDKAATRQVKRNTPPPQSLNLHQRYSDIATDEVRRKLALESGLSASVKENRSESFPCRPNSTPGWHNSLDTTPPDNLVTPLSASSASSSASRPYTGAISKLTDASETASRDSGINMCFGETDTNQFMFGDRGRSSTVAKPASAEVDCCTSPDTVDELPTSLSMRLGQQRTTHHILPRRQQSDPESDNETKKNWLHMPKDVWKQTSEVNQYY